MIEIRQSIKFKLKRLGNSIVMVNKSVKTGEESKLYHEVYSYLSPSLSTIYDDKGRMLSKIETFNFMDSSDYLDGFIKLVTDNNKFNKVFEILKEISIQKKSFLKTLNQLKKMRSSSNLYELDEINEIFNSIDYIDLTNEETLTQFNSKVQNLLDDIEFMK